MKSNAQVVNNVGLTLLYRVLSTDIVLLGNLKTPYLILTITRRGLNL